MPRPRDTTFHIVEYKPRDGELDLPDGKDYPDFIYWDNLRQNQFIPFEVEAGSSIVRIPAHLTPLKNNNNNVTTVRLAHIASMLAITNPLYWRIDPIWHNVQAAAVLALKHLNERSGRIIPDLPERMKECPDLFFTMDFYDSLFSPIHAARQFVGGIVNREHSLQTPLPISLSGATRSEVSENLANLAGVLGIPQISPISSSDSLDSTDIYPYFCRTTSSNRGIARGMAALVHNWGDASTHVAVLYARTTIGISHHRHFTEAARGHGISVIGAPYEPNDPESLDAAILNVVKSGYRHISLAPELGGFAAVAQRAYELGLGGEDHVILLSETNVEVITAGYALNATTHYGAASLLNGSAMVLVAFPQNKDYQESMRSEFLDNPPVMEYYTKKHPAKQLFSDENFDFDPVEDALRSNFAGALQFSQYDAIVAMGLGACQLEDPFFAGPQLYESIKNLSFTGVTTQLQFDNKTCSRNLFGLQYEAYNFVAKPEESGRISFETVTNAQVHMREESTGKVTETVEILTPFTYRDGSGNPPPSVPRITMEMNYVTKGAQIFGWVLAGLIILLSVALAGWTIAKRKTQSVRQRQPVFLCMCCAGTILTAAAIIPMSLQEPVENLDAACNSAIWLASLGFSTAFAALSSKTWRVNMIFRSAQRFRRKSVTSSDVSLPVIVIIAINVALLCSLQVAAPYVYERVLVNNYDRYGRPQESYGTCKASSSKTLWLLGSLLVLNAGAVILSNIQIFLSRDLPDNLNESKGVAFSMLMLLEACLVGVPVVIVVRDSPTVWFLISSCLIFVVCLAILVPQLPTKTVSSHRRLKSEYHPTSNKSENGCSGTHSMLSSRPDRPPNFSSSLPRSEQQHQAGVSATPCEPPMPVSNISVDGDDSSRDGQIL